MADFKLQIEPAEKIVFSGKKLAEEPVVTNIIITNPTKDRLAYKVKCTSNDLFRISPSRGIVKGGADIVRLQFYAGQGVPESGLHYFAVHYIRAEDETKQAKTCWTEHTGRPEGRKEIFVYFKKEGEEYKKNEEKKEDNPEDREDNNEEEN